MAASVADAIRAQAEQAGAMLMPYGPPETGALVVSDFGHYEAEYAALRKAVGIVAMTQRGVVAVDGADRLTFLQAMLSNDMRPAEPASTRACRAFLLGRQGRIEADMVVCIFDDGRCWLDLDGVDAAAVVAELDRHLFAEQATVADASDAVCHLALHGPASATLLQRLGAGSASALAPWQCARVVVSGAECRLYRRDEAGTGPGLHLLVPAAGGAAVYGALAEAVGGLVPEVAGGSKRDLAGRGVGWQAYNTARIEAGTALYHVDFGPDSLPHETGVLQEAVSFTKGCYPGQEVVARMHNLGHPRRTLVGLRGAADLLPACGADVVDAADGSTVIGAVTSSTLSPMLGGAPVAFAMLKWGRHRPGTEVLVAADGRLTPARTQALVFLES